jgi:hypothetical protein
LVAGVELDGAGKVQYQALAQYLKNFTDSHRVIDEKISQDAEVFSSRCEDIAFNVDAVFRSIVAEVEPIRQRYLRLIENDCISDVGPETGVLERLLSQAESNWHPVAAAIERARQTVDYPLENHTRMLAELNDRYEVAKKGENIVFQTGTHKLVLRPA